MRVTDYLSKYYTNVKFFNNKKAVAYTHLDVYKRQEIRLATIETIYLKAALVYLIRIRDTMALYY